MKERLLILFYRNPELGKVKTRLAATIGDEKALAVYFLLTHHTMTVAAPVPCDKIIYYSDFVDTEDNWPSKIFQKSLQQGFGLGDRMMHAFREGFRNYKSICIIGTDCFELTQEILEDAFGQLETHDAVIGPARDGGYYLLGMNRLHPEFFHDKSWSSDLVAAATMNDFRKLGLRFTELPLLTDVDQEKDLPEGVRKSLQLL
jgi:rSAM/selenodomain-associated transferase 1